MMNHLRNHMKGIMLVIVIAFLASTFLMYERGSSRRAGDGSDGRTIADYEVAKINGRSLMRSELDRRLRLYLENYASRNASSLDSASLYKAALDQAVLESQIAKEIEQHGIKISDAEADLEMKSQADTYYVTREAFYQQLAQRGMKVEDYKRNLANQMATQRLLQMEIGEVVISQDSALEFYDTMKGLIYTKPEGFMVQLAEFKNESAAENLRTRILSGDVWAAIVSNDELDSSDVLNFTREPVFLPSSAFTTGVFQSLASLDVGQVSDVFEVSSADFAVGMKAEHVDETITPFDEVSADIISVLTQQERSKRISDYEASLLAKAELIVNDTSLFEKAPTSDDVASESESEPEIEEVMEVEAEPESAETQPEAKSEDVAAESEAATPEVVTEPEAAKSEVESAPEAVKPEIVTEPEAAKSEVGSAPEAVKPEAESESATPEVVTESEAAKSEVESVPEVVKPEVVTEPEAAKSDVESAPEVVKSESEAATPEVVTEPEAVKSDVESAPEVTPATQETQTQETGDAAKTE